jgi:hypothetical protein
MKSVIKVFILFKGYLKTAFIGKKIFRPNLKVMIYFPGFRKPALTAHQGSNGNNILHLNNVHCKEILQVNRP